MDEVFKLGVGVILSTTWLYWLYHKTNRLTEELHRDLIKNSASQNQTSYTLEKLERRIAAIEFAVWDLKRALDAKARRLSNLE
jgi:hypothetical protein